MSAHTPREFREFSGRPAATLLEDQFPHDACTLTRLKLSDAHFCHLAERYHALNRSIHRIEIEVECASDAYLTRLRKQRLLLLDAIAVMIEEAERQANDAHGSTPTPPAAGVFGRLETAAA